MFDVDFLAQAGCCCVNMSTIQQNKYQTKSETKDAILSSIALGPTIKSLETHSASYMGHIEKQLEKRGTKASFCSGKVSPKKLNHSESHHSVSCGNLSYGAGLVFFSGALCGWTESFVAGLLRSIWGSCL